MASNNGKDEFRIIMPQDDIDNEIRKLIFAKRQQVSLVVFLKWLTNMGDWIDRQIRRGKKHLEDNLPE